MTAINPSVFHFRGAYYKPVKFAKSPIKGLNAENNEAFGTMISDFLQHTSVPGLSQAGSRKNRGWRFSWVLMTILGLAMAVYQSWNVIQDYLQNSVVQRIAYSTPAVLPFPSITVCSNVFIDEKSLRELSVFDPKLLDFLQWNNPNSNSPNSESIPKFQSKYRRLSHHLLHRKWNESLRMQLCGSIEKRFEFITLRPDPAYSYLNFERAEALGVLHHFHNYAFGCCFTVNPGFDTSNAVLNGRGKELLIQLNMDVTNRMIESNDFFASVVVHPLSTPPIMGSSDTIEVYPGDYFKILLKLTKTDRSAKASSCVNNDDLEWRKKLALYSTKTPYIYSMLACEETCAQMTLQWSERPAAACLRAESPITAEIIRDDPYPTFCDPNIATDSLSRSNYSCNCPLACKENLPKKSVISMSGLNWIAYKNMIKLNNTGIKGAEQAFLLSNYQSAMIKVMYESPQVEIIVEENKYSVADFWGIIGGNLGLWVGLCLLSCIEVVELVSSVLSAFCKCRR